MDEILIKPCNTLVNKMVRLALHYHNFFFFLSRLLPWVKMSNRVIFSHVPVRLMNFGKINIGKLMHIAQGDTKHPEF